VLVDVDVDVDGMTHHPLHTQSCYADSESPECAGLTFSTLVSNTQKCPKLTLLPPTNPIQPVFAQMQGYLLGGDMFFNN